MDNDTFLNTTDRAAIQSLSKDDTKLATVLNFTLNLSHKFNINDWEFVMSEIPINKHSLKKYIKLYYAIAKYIEQNNIAGPHCVIARRVIMKEIDAMREEVKSKLKTRHDTHS